MFACAPPRAGRVEQRQVRGVDQPVERATRLLVALDGDIDLAARPELEELLATLDPAHLERVVIDLRDVTFLDSTGLHMAQRFDRWGRDNAVTVVFTRGSRR